MRILNTILAMFLTVSACSCNNDMPEYTAPEEVPAQTDGGYLFAFMTNANYGKLYYAMSRDAFNWETLNNGQIIDKEYIGHPDIMQGHDGAFYMIAVTGNGTGISLWRSEDMVAWDKTPLDPNIINSANADGFYITYYFGAPKMFFDKESQQYIITWHACLVPKYDDWDSMTTLYVLTKDFKTFTHPQRLFHFTGDDEKIATIDTIIRKIGGKYYAILKDERKVEDAPATGKTIRIAVSDNLTRSYSNPGVPVTEAWREAPIFVERPGDTGFAIFAENYNTSPWGYNMYVSETMDMTQPWKLRMFVDPCVADGTNRPGARHGCIVRINESVYQAIANAYSTKK